MFRSFDPSFSRRAALRALAALGLGARPPATGIAFATQPAATPEASPSVGLSSDKFLAFMQMVSGRMTEAGVPAVVVGVVHNDARATCGLGVTNVDAPAQASAQTLFRVASLSKLFTGSAIGSLIDDGAIDLDEPVRTYLPNFTVSDPQASEDVLVRHLVTHSAGWLGTLRLDPGPEDDALARYVEGMANLPQITPPGSQFSYNNAAVILAGYLVAEMTGKDFESAVRDLTLSPLSMDASSFLASDIGEKPIAFGHAQDGEALRVIDPMESVRAAAPVNGLITNVDELLSFAAFHADASRAKPSGYLSEDTRILSHSPLGPGGSVGPVILDATGLSWMLTSVGGAQVSVHAGNDFGQSSIIAVVPSEGFGVVILTNADAGEVLSLELMLEALDHFLGLKQVEPKSIDVSASVIDEVVGDYRFIDGPAVFVSTSGSGLRLDAAVNGQALPDSSGDLAFIATDRARLDTGNQVLYVDFVRDGDGAVAWIRHLGQLAHRTDR